MPGVYLDQVGIQFVAVFGQAFDPDIVSQVVFKV
jgi:hypothetical protein